MEKNVYILAIESSCDETSCAIVLNGRKVLSNIISSQISEHEKYGGVVPEIASRMHIEAISNVVDKAIKDAGITVKDISAVAVTKGPGLVGALLVGVSFAKTFAYMNNIPLLGVHHLEGHIAANYIEHKELTPPFLALIVSGGHTHLVHVKDYTKFDIIGRTKDDAIGEAFDKVARVVGLGYPGGPKIDNAAKQGKTTYIDKIPIPKVDGYDFSFSGIKTAIINLNHNSKEKLDIADLSASFQHRVTEILVNKAKKALTDLNLNNLVLAGGVSANSYIRNEFDKLKTENINIYYPSLVLCTDNAAMIGAQAYYYYINNMFSNYDIDAKPNLPIGI